MRRLPSGKVHVFRSKAEAEYFDALWLRERAGEVKGIEVEPEYDLAGVTYRPDFRFKERVGAYVGSKGHWLETVVEVKSKRVSKTSEQMRRFRRNQKQMRALHAVEVALVLR